MEARKAAPAPEEVKEQFARIMGSSWFKTSPRQRQILQIIQEEYLKDGGVSITSELIGIALGEEAKKDDPDHPSSNSYPNARANTNHVRKKLNRFYESEGYTDRVMVKLEAGRFTPIIELNPAFQKMPPLERDAESLIMRMKIAFDLGVATLEPRGSLTFSVAWREERRLRLLEKAGI